MIYHQRCNWFNWWARICDWFSKDDELTNGLKSFADLDKTLYYKRDNEGLLATDNESEAVIKIVGNKSENKAILTAVNVGTKKVKF